MKHFIISALNKYLQQDVERASQLNQIEGKLVRIVIREIDLDLLVLVEDGIFQLADNDLTADVEIIVSAKVLSDTLMGVDQDQLIKSGKIEINGDAHIASVMQNTLRDIEIDWEEIVSKYTGDTIAHQLGKGARALHTFRKDLHDNLRQDMRDYLQDNIQVSATQEEVEQFIQEVDTMRAQLDRLEARIDRLQARDR